MRNLIMKIIISFKKIKPLMVLKFKITEAIKKIRYKIKALINNIKTRIRVVIDYIQSKTKIKAIIDYINPKIKPIIGYIKVKIKPIIKYIQSRTKITLFCLVGFIFLVLVGWKIDYNIKNFDLLLNPKPLFLSLLLLWCGLSFLKLYLKILFSFIKKILIFSLKERHIIILFGAIFSLLFLGKAILVSGNFDWQSLVINFVWETLINNLDWESLINNFDLKLLESWLANPLEKIYELAVNFFKAQSLYLLIPFIISLLIILVYILYAIIRFLIWTICFSLLILSISLYILVLFYYIRFLFEILKYLLPI